MRTGGFLLAACVGISCMPTTAEAQALRLTLADTLTRAREQAPRVVTARLWLEEARARVLGAGIRQNNPELDIGVGRRRGDGSGSTDIDVGVSQLFEPSGRRAARIAIANEGVGQG